MTTIAKLENRIEAIKILIAGWKEQIKKPDFSPDLAEFAVKKIKKLKKEKKYLRNLVKTLYP